jgi:ribosome assembly protein 1
MQQWLPLSTTTFQAVVDVIPSPVTAQANRLPYMIHSDLHNLGSDAIQPKNELERALYRCAQGEGDQVVGYVSKMFAVRRGDLPGFKVKEMTAEEMRQRGKEERERRAAALAAGADGEAERAIVRPLESLNLEEAPDSTDGKPSEPESPEVLLGFSRVFSGILRRNTEMIGTLPKYNADLPSTHPRNAKYVVRVKVKDLYTMMGRELVAVEEVPAGHVCAIGGLDGVVFRSATLWAPNAAGVKEGQGKEELINLAGVSMQAAPIVRVALEPENPSECYELYPKRYADDQVICLSSLGGCRSSTRLILVPSTWYRRQANMSS